MDEGVAEVEREADEAAGGQDHRLAGKAAEPPPPTDRPKGAAAFSEAQMAEEDSEPQEAQKGSSEATEANRRATSRRRSYSPNRSPKPKTQSRRTSARRTSRRCSPENPGHLTSRRPDGVLPAHSRYVDGRWSSAIPAELHQSVGRSLHGVEKTPGPVVQRLGNHHVDLVAHGGDRNRTGVRRARGSDRDSDPL